MEIKVDIRDKKIQNNIETMLKIIKQWGEAITYASGKLKSDPKFNYQALIINSNSYKFISKKLRLNDKKIIQETIRCRGLGLLPDLDYFKEINPKLRDNYGFINSCLDICTLPHIKPANDDFPRRIIENSFRGDIKFFRYVSDRLKKNKKLSLKAIKLGYSLYNTHHLINNKKALFAHAKYNGSIEPTSEWDEKKEEWSTKNRSIPKQFIENKELITEFVKEYPWHYGRYVDANLEYLKKINSKYLNDEEIAKNAVETRVSSIFYFNKRFRSKEKFIISIIKKQPEILKYIDKKFIKNRRFVEEAIKLNGNSILYVDQRFSKNKILVFKALDNGLNHFNDKRFKIYSNNKDFINKSLEKNLSFYPYMNINFKLDKNLATKAINENHENFKFVPKILRKDKIIAFLAITKFFDISLLKFLDKKLFSDKNFILDVLKELSDWRNYWITQWHDNNDKPLFWRFFNKKFKKDKDFIVKALSFNYDYKYIFELDDFYVNGKYDKFMFELLTKNDSIILKKDGKVVWGNEKLKNYWKKKEHTNRLFVIDLNNRNKNRD